MLNDGPAVRVRRLLIWPLLLLGLLTALFLVRHREAEPRAALARPATVKERRAIPVPRPSSPPAPARAPEPLPRCGRMPVRGRTLLGYGWIYSPTLRDWRFHDGVDLEARPLTPVLAGWSGSILRVSSSDPRSIRVVEAVGPYRIVYDDLTAVTVRPGETVQAGKVIGRIGESRLDESAEPPHLHLSIREGSRPLDPWKYLIH